jgi:hypothetical protein
MPADLSWQNYLKSKDSKSFSVFCIRFCATGGLPSHRTADCILSLVFKVANTIEEINPYHVPTSLFDKTPTSQRHII